MEQRWTEPEPEKDELLRLIDQQKEQCTRLKHYSTTFTTSLGLEDAGYHEAKDLSVEEVKEKLEALQKRLDSGDDFSMITRGKANTTYRACSDGVKRLTVKDINKRCKPGDGRIKKISDMVKRILEAIQNNRREAHRGMYYLMKKEKEVDGMFTPKDEYNTVDDICCDVMCTTSSLYVEASVRGIVGGHLSWNKKRSFIDCDSGYDGWRVPLSLSEISNLQINGARFVLVVEKETTLRDIMQSQFYIDYKCIIITGMGTPSMATKRFAKLLWDEFGLPMYALFDCDPSGIRMFTNYTIGTYNKAFDSVNLTCPYMTWLGVWPSDLIHLSIRCENLDDKDIKAVDDLLEEPFVTDNPRLLQELGYMKDTKLKGSIEALKEWYGPDWTKFLAYKMNYALTDKSTD